MSKKKTIFFLINSMENGGAERVLSNILPPLSQDYNIYLILLKDKIFYNLPKRVKIIALSKIKLTFLMFFLFPVYIIKFRKLIKQYHPVRVISFLEIANFVNILSNQKAIISLRVSLSFFDNPGVINTIYLAIIKNLYPKAKKIITNSKENRLDIAKKLNTPLLAITTIHNPINMPQIIKLKNVPVNLPFKKQPTNKIFISVSRLNKQKNLTTLIATFKNTKKNNKLLIIGDGSEKEKLNNLIIKNNLQKKIFLLGRQKNVYKYLNISNYFIFSSRAEGFPNVLIEAMACNLPIITSDFKTGAREIIDPNLNFNTKIKYPHYGPNGVLLSLDTFKEDFEKINFNKLHQQQNLLNAFQINKIIREWDYFITSK